MACKKETKRQEKKRYRERNSTNNSKYSDKKESSINNNKISDTIINQLNSAKKSGNKKIEITYEDKRGKVTLRKIDIYDVTSKHLIGYCYKVSDRRTFLISGILHIHIIS